MVLSGCQWWPTSQLATPNTQSIQAPIKHSWPVARVRRVRQRPNSVCWFLGRSRKWILWFSLLVSTRTPGLMCVFILFSNPSRATPQPPAWKSSKRLSMHGAHNWPKQTPNRQCIVFVDRDVGVTSGNPFEVNTLDLMALSIKVSLEVTVCCG